MVKKLRRKFIIMSVGVAFVVMVVIAGFINIASLRQISANADSLLTLLVSNGGYFPKKDAHKEGYELPPKMSPETPFSTRFFTVKTNAEGAVISVDTGKVSVTSTKKAIEYAEQVVRSGKEDGFLSFYKYKVAATDTGSLIVFVDCRNELQLFRDNLLNSVVICIIGTAAFFVMVLPASARAVAPVAASYEKQKRFITDASHELKTPLAIISAGAEAMELEQGESRWTQSILHQVNRLSELVGCLISLTRMDEDANQLLKVDFSLSDAVSETAGQFVTVAAANSLTLEMQLEQGITFCGDEGSIRQLVEILLENAIKYALPKSVIQLSLQQQGRRSVLRVANEAGGLQRGSYDRLFERFYRADNSRNSETGGYGLGLSIARSIVGKHRGRITAESADGKTICFTVTLG